MEPFLVLLNFSKFQSVSISLNKGHNFLLYYKELQGGDGKNVEE